MIAAFRPACRISEFPIDGARPDRMDFCSWTVSSVSSVGLGGASW